MTAGLSAQQSNEPRRLYCGGNEMIFVGDIWGSAVAGVVVDPTGAAIPQARVQVQVVGRDKILKTLNANGKVRFFWEACYHDNTGWEFQRLVSTWTVGVSPSSDLRATSGSAPPSALAPDIYTCAAAAADRSAAPRAGTAARR
jgi:hypothetical protein